MKAVNMICNRNCTLRTTFGSIQFFEDVERLVAPQMVEAALAIGVKLVNPKDDPFEATPANAQEPTDPGSRLAIITSAVEEMYERNDPNEFTTGSTPKLTDVARISGLTKVSGAEVKKVLTVRNKRIEEAAAEAKRLDNETKIAKKKAAKAKKNEDPPDNEL